jgi:hypothetical protein
MGETTMRFLSSISRIFRGVNSFIFSRLLRGVLRCDYSMLAAARSLARSGFRPKCNATAGNLGILIGSPIKTPKFWAIRLQTTLQGEPLRERRAARRVSLSNL